MQGVPLSDVGSGQFGHERSACAVGAMAHRDATEACSYQVNMKTEPHMYGGSSSVEELQHLRARVQLLEREKAEMVAENQRLKDLLVKEIPHLLSTMWQTLTSNSGQANHHHHHHHHQSQPALSESVTTAISSYADVSYKEQSCSLPLSFTATVKNIQQEMILGNAGFGLKMDAVHNLEDEDMFAPINKVNGELCPVGLDDHDEYLSSPYSSADSTSSCNQHVRLTEDGPHVEVFPGSGVFCSEQTWRAAGMTRTPTAMVRALLLGVFDMDTLLKSNLRGGRSRRPTFTDRHAPLDPAKLNAIYNATLARFPLARKGQIGTGINSKLSEIRFRSRKVKRDRRGR